MEQIQRSSSTYEYVKSISLWLMSHNLWIVTLYCIVSVTVNLRNICLSINILTFLSKLQTRDWKFTLYYCKLLKQLAQISAVSYPMRFSWRPSQLKCVCVCPPPPPPVKLVKRPVRMHRFSASVDIAERKDMCACACVCVSCTRGAASDLFGYHYYHQISSWENNTYIRGSSNSIIFFRVDRFLYVSV